MGDSRQRAHQFAESGPDRPGLGSAGRGRSSGAGGWGATDGDGLGDLAGAELGLALSQVVGCGDLRGGDGLAGALVDATDDGCGRKALRPVRGRARVGAVEQAVVWMPLADTASHAVGTGSTWSWASDHERCAGRSGPLRGAGEGAHYEACFGVGVGRDDVDRRRVHCGAQGYFSSTCCAPGGTPLASADVGDLRRSGTVSGCWSLPPDGDVRRLARKVRRQRGPRIRPLLALPAQASCWS